MSTVRTGRDRDWLPVGGGGGAAVWAAVPPWPRTGSVAGQSRENSKECRDV